jgi:hypothetical protein
MLAVQKRYRLIKVYEVYEYQVTRYDHETREGGLFAQYVDTFLKLKAEASGYPDWVCDAEEQDRYVREFSASEGVALDKDAIRPNPAKRDLAKLCLNSMCGKLTERNNRTKTMLITDPLELYRFLSTPGSTWETTSSPTTRLSGPRGASRQRKKSLLWRTLTRLSEPT